MNDPLTGLLQGYGTDRIGGFELPFGQRDGSLPDSSAQPSVTLVELGQKLYSALFQGTLRDSWVTAQGIAQHKGELLRLRLGLKGPKLPRLPWEVLYASDGSSDRSRRMGTLGPAPRPIAAGTDVLFSRYQPGTGVGGSSALPIEPDQPLRILMAIATPPDQEWLELKREAHHLQEELLAYGGAATDSNHKLPDIQLTILEQPGREQLTQALEQGQYHVLHYAGHSNLGAAGGNLYLVNNRTGLTETLSGDDLAGLLVNNGIWMAVFNSCRGAHTAASDPLVNEGERNLAEALVNRGIPAVLAMAERIPDDVALNLTRLFYRNLKLGCPIDLSLSRARQGLITSYGSHQLYWALPMLYMDEKFDGYLTVHGDRTLNPSADQLVVLPALSDAQFTLAGEEAPSTASTSPVDLALETEDDLAIISKAVLDDDDDLDLIEDFENYNGMIQHEDAEDSDDNEDEDLSYEDDIAASEDSDDDLSYEEDAAVVAGLIQQLSSQEGLTEQPSVSEDKLAVTASEKRSSQTADLPNLNGYGDRSARSASRSSAWDEPDNGTVSTRPPTPAYHASGNQVLPTNASGSSTSVSQRRSRKRTDYPSLLIPAAVAVGVVVFAGILWQSGVLRSLQASRPVPSPTSSASVSPSPSSSAAASPGNTDLSKAKTDDLVLMATNNFSQPQLSDENVAEGGRAITALLDRGDLETVEALLTNVPSEDASNPDISFLKGRLAWQQFKQGNSDYSENDVQRFWETAVTGSPESAGYYNALGFLLYSQGKSQQAIETWCQALKLLKQQADFTSGSIHAVSDCPVPTQPITDVSDPTVKVDILDASAGIALALKRGVEMDGFDHPEEQMTESIALYGTVIKSDPTQFQPTELLKTWLWTDTAVEEWRSLASR
jgi:tetratricopeptide (TPR) repeat protein